MPRGQGALVRRQLPSLHSENSYENSLKVYFKVTHPYLNSKKNRLAIGLYGQMVRKPLLFRHTTSRHGRARRAMNTASTATKLRTRGFGRSAYRTVLVF